MLSRLVCELLSGKDLELAERCSDLSADRGLDGAVLKKALWGECRIRPWIDTREIWRDEKAGPDYDPSKTIIRPLYPERVDTVLRS